MNEYLITILATSLVYIFLIGALLIFGKQEISQLSIIDLVFILLISNAVQNAMMNGDWKSLATGLLAASTLFVLNFLLKALVFRNGFFNKLIEGKPVILIYNGEVVKDNVKHEEITMNELEAAVREHGVANISEVSLAVLETDGNISVISLDPSKKTSVKRRDKKPPLGWRDN